MTRKLRVLCLHGQETNAQILEWQLRTFRETYSELLELTFVDSPHLSGRKRYQPFAERGFRPPCRKWAELEVDVFYKTQDKFDISYTEETLYLVQETVLFLTNYLNDHGPFDGLLGFS